MQWHAVKRLGELQQRERSLQIEWFTVDALFLVCVLVCVRVFCVCPYLRVYNGILYITLIQPTNNTAHTHTDFVCMLRQVLLPSRFHTLTLTHIQQVHRLAVLGLQMYNIHLTALGNVVHIYMYMYIYAYVCVLSICMYVCVCVHVFLFYSYACPLTRSSSL